MKTLYPEQQAGVAAFLATPHPHRLILGWDMGCGKTVGAAKIIEELQPKRVIIVCPALVRYHWQMELVDVVEPQRIGIIEYGRGRKGLSKKAAAQSAAAYQADIKIVSYALLDEVLENVDLIIFDEMHRLQHPTSLQSKTARKLVKMNPEAHMVLLTGTPIPTEVRGLWHPLHLGWPSDWGRLESNGRESYQFLNRYCKKEVSEHGTKFYSILEEKKPELAARLQRYVHRLTREELRPYMQPIDVRPLRVVDTARVDLLKVGEEWCADAFEAASHVGIFCYHHELALALAERLTQIYGPQMITRADAAPLERLRALEEARSAPRNIFIGTTESFREGIRMMWMQQVLVLEWRQSPVQVAQFLGRFDSVGWGGPVPQVQVLVTAEQTVAARRLFTRMQAINDILRSGKNHQKMQGLFTYVEPTQEELDVRFAAALNAMQLDRLDWDGDVDE